MVEVMRIMRTSFKRSHAPTARFSAPNPATGHHQHTPLPETPGYSRASMGQSLVGWLLLSPGSWCVQDSVCALPESDNLDSILKSKDITLPTKFHLVKSMVFLVVMYGCESGTIKKAEIRRIDAFELCCWRRLLRVPWTARRSNQSILKKINPECSLEELMLNLKFQYFGQLMQRTD